MPPLQAREQITKMVKKVFKYAQMKKVKKVLLGHEKTQLCPSS